jgi:hypothetical protein
MFIVATVRKHKINAERACPAAGTSGVPIPDPSWLVPPEILSNPPLVTIQEAP